MYPCVDRSLAVADLDVMKAMSELRDMVQDEGVVVLFRGCRVTEVQIVGPDQVTFHCREPRRISTLLDEGDLANHGMLRQELRVFRLDLKCPPFGGLSDV